MNSDVALAQLQEDIHTALKNWNETGATTSSLASLQLFRQAQREENATPRRAANQILLAALDELAVAHPERANLLRLHFLDGMLMQTIANRLNIGQSTVYRQQQEALRQLALIVQTREAQARTVEHTALEKRLRLPPETRLFGVDDPLNRLLANLLTADAPWLAAVEGLGGSGKTALANAAIRRPELLSRFRDTAWVSAKQRDFWPGVELADADAPALTGETLVDTLLAQLGQPAAATQSPAQKSAALTHLLKQAPYLIVIDNLETVADYQALLPLLWEIANPSKVLLTSRHSLRAYPHVFCLTLAPLNQAETLDLIRYEAGTRGLFMLARADEAQLLPVYQVVGGNPLALKLVVGQAAFLPLTQVLANLREAQGKSVTDLYTYIYWQGWHMLTEAGRQTLLIMPLAQDGTLDQLLALSQLEPAELHQAIQHLATLSLVQVEGDLEERRYAIHRLTETFLLREAITWQSSA